MTLLNNVGLWNIIVGCWQLNYDISLPTQLFEHPTIIF